MKINKKYKLEEVTSSDKTREVFKSVYVYQNGRPWAVATDGRILAKVPVEIEEKELERGNSIKGTDFKFQRQNPAIKKQDDMFCFLQPLPSEYPNFEAIFPTVEPVVEIALDVALLMSLAKGLGTEKVTLKIIDNNKAIRVSPLIGDKEAHGLIMPCRID